MFFVNDLKSRGHLRLILSVITIVTSAQVSAQSQSAAGAPSPTPVPPTSEVPPSEPTTPTEAPTSPAQEPTAPPAAPETPTSPVPPPAEPLAPAASAPNAAPSPSEPSEPAADATQGAAANPDDAANSGEDSATELGSVIVSARRRNESVQEVPVAISVLSGDNLEAKGAVNLQSFHKEVPSVTSYSTNARNTTINIRGLGTGTAAGGAAGLDSGVGFYVDDVYYGRLSQSILNLIDIDRIEVLRGPQGTLFGRNTTAGAISVVTRGPSWTPEGTADLSIGNLGYLQLRGSLSGPIVDKKLAVRVSGEALTRDGILYSTNLLDSLHRQESFSVRGQLLYQPIEALKLRLIADYAKFGQNCCTTTPYGAVTNYDNGKPLAYPYAARIAQFPGYTNLPNDPGARLTDVDRQRFFRVQQGGASLRADLDVGSHTITSIAAARAWNTNPRNDGDGTALDVQRESNDDDRQFQVTEELRLASNGTKVIDHVVGLYFLYQHLPTLLRRDYGSQAGEFNIAPDTNGLSAEQRKAVLDGQYTRTRTQTNTLSAAAFGQGTWHIYNGLDLTGGVRYTFERKFGDFELKEGSRTDVSGLNDAQLKLRAGYIAAIPYYELDKSWSSLGALATVSQKLGDDHLAFVTYSRGSKSGGLNFRDLPRDQDGKVRPEFLVLKPEIVDSFEAGLKTQWLNHRLTVNATVFHTYIRDYQNTVVAVYPERSLMYISNVGSVRSRGVELELKARPVNGLNVYAAATYNIADYVSYKGAQCPWEARAPGEPVQCDLSGQQLPVAPKLGAAIGGDFTVRLTSWLDGFIGADYNYRSSYTTTTNNSRYSRVEPVGLVNARLGLKDPGGRWQGNIWSQNLLDELVFLSKAVNEQTGRLSGLVGDPRTFGATFRYYFD